MADNYMTFNDAVEVLTPYAEKINTIKPESITWAAYQLLTSEQKAAKRYLITDYPSPTGYVNKLSDLEDVSINSQTLADGQMLTYNNTDEVWENKTILENSLTSTATDKALTAAKGKELQDNKQDKELETPITVAGTSKTTVEGALDGINDYVDDTVEAAFDVYGAKNLAILDLGSIMPINTGGTWSGNVYSHRSVDFTVTKNGVSVSGTASGGAAFIDIPISSLKNGNNYIANGISGGSDGTYQIKFMNSSLVVQNVDDLYEGERTFEKNSTNQNVEIYRIRVASGANVTTNIYPMIRDARITDDTFVPFAKTNLQLTNDKAEKSQLSNENLLDNGWFTVNQRGATTVTSGYGADRWKMVDGSSATFSSSGVTMIAQLNNYFENQLPNGVYTASIKYADGTIESGTLTKSNDTDTIRFIQRVGLTLGYAASGKFFYVYTDVSTSIRAVKLELGSVSTLANDVAPNYTTELLKCQRYFYRLTNAVQICVSFASSVDAASAIFNLPVPMRTTPTFTYGGSFYLRYMGANEPITNIVEGGSNNERIGLSLSISGALTIGQAGYFNASNTSAYLDFSADL